MGASFNSIGFGCNWILNILSNNYLHISCAFDAKYLFLVVLCAEILLNVGTDIETDAKIHICLKFRQLIFALPVTVSINFCTKCI